LRGAGNFQMTTGHRVPLAAHDRKMPARAAPGLPVLGFDLRSGATSPSSRFMMPVAGQTRENWNCSKFPLRQILWPANITKTKMVERKAKTTLNKNQ